MNLFLTFILLLLPGIRFYFLTPPPLSPLFYHTKAHLKGVRGLGEESCLEQLAYLALAASFDYLLADGQRLCSFSTVSMPAS